MADKKIIAVVGATGAQGGGLVRAILADKSGSYTARALTTDIHSTKAKELGRLGAEVLHANLDDQESLTKAFKGADAAYCVTFYWSHFSPEKETAQGINLAKAAKQSGVKHVIWSTFEDTRKWVPLNDSRMPTLMNKYKVPHFDSKSEVDRSYIELGVPVTFLYTSFYWDNFINFGMGPKRGADGKYTLTLPIGNKKMPGIAAKDIGKCAFGVFKRSPEFIGKTIGIAGEHLTGAQMAATFTKVLGKEFRYFEVSPEEYRNLGFPGADDMANMFQFKRDFEADYCGARSVEFSRELNPALLTFERWLTENKSNIPLEAKTVSA